MRSPLEPGNDARLQRPSVDVSWAGIQPGDPCDQPGVSGRTQAKRSSASSTIFTVIASRRTTTPASALAIFTMNVLSPVRTPSSIVYTLMVVELPLPGGRYTELDNCT